MADEVAPPPHRGFHLFSLLTTCLVILLGGGLIYEYKMYQALTQHVNRLSEQLMIMENSLNTVYLQLGQHEDQLIRITNHTSNAEVLDKMNDYQHQFESSVDSVRQSLASASQEFHQLHLNNRMELQALSLNISYAIKDDLNTLHRSLNTSLGSTQNSIHMEMERTLSSVGMIEQNLSDEVNSAKVELRGNVDKALLTMNGIQQDIYDQIFVSHQKVNDSIHNMERQVEKGLLGAIRYVNQVNILCIIYYY